MIAQLQEVDAAQLAEMIRGAHALLAANKEAVDALNVFPVPDGDTGINMSLTIGSAVKCIDGLENGSVGDLVKEFATGALMGARGNSGVILSQMIRGFAQGLAGKQTANALDLAQAVQRGVELSYKSVMKPVEGTILTVFKDFGQAAMQAAEGGFDILAVFEEAYAAGEKSLANTPNLLPVLKEAGVVDAGGQGLLVLLQGALATAKGQPLVPLAPVAAAPKEPALPRQAAARDDISTAQIEFGYCTQLLIRGENLNPEQIREHLSKEPPGDSLLVVGDEHVVKIHFHNNHPGQVLEYCAQFGSLHDIIIDNMHDQHHENRLLAELGEPAEAEPAAKTEPAATATAVLPPEITAGTPQTAVIAVCSGEGMMQLFRALGAWVIPGGQTMNPAAEDLLAAIEQVEADEIVILPNNSNIILTAGQAAALTERQVLVVPSKYLTQGVAAMLLYNPQSSAASNEQQMTEALSQVISGELTYAVRDSKYEGMEIAAGDYLALVQGKIIDHGPELEEQLLGMLRRMVADFGEDTALISLYYGEDVDEELAAHCQALVEEAFPGVDLEMASGGQPLYYFLASVE